MAAEEARQEAVREEIQDLENRYGYQDEHVLVLKEGSAFVNGGKLSKIGRFETIPSLGDCCGDMLESTDERGRCRAWYPVPVGRLVTVRDFAGSGNLNSESSFVIPAGLAPGVWGVTVDGKMFISAIYYREGCEILPETVTAVPAGKVSKDELVCFELESKLAELRREQEGYEESVRWAEEDVAFSGHLRLSFRRGEHRGNVQWQAGSRKSRRYVLDRYCRTEITEGHTYYCRVVRELVPGRVVAVDAYLQADRDLAAEIAELEAKLTRKSEKTESKAVEAVSAVPEKTAPPAWEDLGDGLEMLRGKWGC